MKWWDQMPWSSFFQCWVLSQLFHSPPSLSKRGSYFLFTFCHKGGVICISEVIGISPSNLDSSFCSSSPAFHMIYSGYKLTMQCDNIQLWCALSQFGTSPLFHVWFCYFLTCIQIFRRQIKQSGIQISLRIFQFVVIHTVKDFGVVSEAEVDVLLEFSCFFYDPMDIGNLISGFSAFSESSLNIWRFSVHILLKPSLENFEHYFASMWDECNSVVVWTFFSIAFLWDWNENWPVLVLWPLLSFPNLLANWVQHFHSIIF